MLQSGQLHEKLGPPAYDGSSTGLVSLYHYSAGGGGAQKALDRGGAPGILHRALILGLRELLGRFELRHGSLGPHHPQLLDSFLLVEDDPSAPGDLPAISRAERGTLPLGRIQDVEAELLTAQRRAFIENVEITGLRAGDVKANRRSSRPEA